MMIVVIRDVEPSFFVGLYGFKNWDSDSDSSPKKSPVSDPGLKSDTNSWTCVIVTVYWVNDADRQIIKI